MLKRSSFRTAKVELFLLATTIVLAIAATSAIGQPPTGRALDKSFNGKGYVSISRSGHGHSQQTGNCFVNNDGSSFIYSQIGKFKKHGDWEPSFIPSGWFLQRYTASGKLDRRFGRRGDVRSIGIRRSQIWSAATDAGGRLLLTARASSLVRRGTRATFVVRLNKRGRIDRSFGDNGRIELPDTTEYAPGSIIELQNGQLLLLLGSGRTKIRLVRLTAEGKPVEGFDGRIETPLSPNDVQIAELSDGSIVVGATDHSPTGSPESQAVILKFDAMGKPDSAWANAGKFVASSFPTSLLRSDAPIAEQSGRSDHSVVGLRGIANGRLSVAIASDDPDDDVDGDGLVWTSRLTASGALDLEYGKAGAQELVDADGIFEPSTSDYEAHWYQPLADGSWLAPGYSFIDQGNVFVSRVSADGKHRDTPIGYRASRFRGYTDVTSLMASEDGKRLTGCATTTTETSKPRSSGLVFRMLIER